MTINKYRRMLSIVVSLSIVMSLGFVSYADESEDLTVESAEETISSDDDIVYEELVTYDAMNSSYIYYEGRFEYTFEYLDDGTIKITSIDCSSSGTINLVIPSVIDGHTVSTIGNGSACIHYNCRDRVISIIVPDSVTDIEKAAFCWCSNLVSITLPSGLTAINDSLFFNDISLTSITIPSTVGYIGTSSFSGCTSLRSVIIPEGVTALNCPSNYGIFEGCTNLRTIYLPRSVQYINCVAFNGCDSLTDVYYAGTNGESDDIVFVGTWCDPILNATWHYSALDMYRLYNPNSGEHFYTSSSDERDVLIDAGWNYEGIGWIAPSTSSTPVYRLYNPYAGEHHYTTSVDERNNLISVGWNDEGIGWYSDDNCSIPLYRQYNPNEYANNHNYTTSQEENNYLISIGWRPEGIGWYGVG